MRKLLYFLSLVGLALVPWNATAQFQSLSTPITQNNGQAGVTFEVIAARSVTVKKIWTNMDVGTHTVEIYTRPGGDIGTFTGWTLIGTGTAVSTSLTTFAEIQAPLNVQIPAGQSMGFFIVVPAGSAINYTTASAPQSNWMFSDQNITIDAYGWGASYNMTSSFSPRSFNGRVDYVTAGATNDIGVVSIDSVLTACPGQQNIWATIGNFGSNQVASAFVNWTWNGVAQTPIFVQTLLDTFNGSGSNTTPVFLGTRAFSAGVINTISVSTSAPNGGTDTVAFNNTLVDQLAASLSGVFTINQGLPSGGSNFNSVQDAMTAVGTFGLCGPTEFHLAEGAYIGQFNLGAVPGGSATNTLTIKPNPSNAGNTIIAFNATVAADPHIVRFQGASYITLEGLKFLPLGTTYQRSIDFYGSNDHITIRNCRFENTATSTSTNFSHIYNQSGTGAMTEHCTIEGNTFIGGSYAVYWYGGSTTVMEDGNKFLNNTIKDYYYMGLAWTYQANGIVSGNDIEAKTSGNYSTNYGLYHYYSDFGTVTNNRIVAAGTGTNYGMYMYYNDGSSLNKVLVANNMVSCLDNTGTVYGIYAYNNTHANYYHNTVHVNKGGTSTTSTPLYAYGSSAIYGPVEIVNNSFSNIGGGYAANVYNRYGLIASIQNNNFYTSGSNLGYYVNPTGGITTATNLTAFQNAIGTLAANCVSEEPLFLNDRDLHTITPGLDSKGLAGTGITLDIDGEVRCPGAGCPGAKSAPDMGADEFEPPLVDASAIEVSLPCPGLVDVYVTVQNVAVNPLNTVRVYCTVNGSPTSGSGLVYNVGGLVPGATGVVNVGQFNFVSGNSYTILATTAKPNGINDPNISNDSATVTGFPSLGGTFTVGGSNPDFASLTAAIDAMMNSGICAPVTILIREGIYNEQPWIDEIPGTSAMNTVTIMPDPSNTLPVEFAFANTTSAKATVFRFNNASYITLKDFMISPTGTTYKRAVAFVGTNHHITLDGLTMQNTGTSTTSNNESLIWNNSGTDNMTEHCTIQNCTITGGSYAVYWYGGSTTVMEDGNKFLNNTIKDYYYMGLAWSYQTNGVVDGNDIEAKTAGNYSTNYGLYHYYSDFGTVTNNRIIAAGTSTNYGIYAYYNDASSTNYGLFANNMISCLDNTGTNYGIYLYNNTYINYYHNSILVNKGTTSATGTSRGVYIYGSSAIYGPVNWVNNSVANLGGGPAAYIYDNYGYLGAMDNNNWYASGTNLGYYDSQSGTGSYRSSLAAWQTATAPFDQNAISVNPSHDGDRDLHLSSIQMNAAGATGLGITTDIDGDIRCPGAGCPGGLGAPDIGADEYEVPPVDLGISGLINPVNGKGCDYRAFEPVVVTITNYGSEAVNLALNPAVITVNVSGASTRVLTITIRSGAIPVGGSLSWPVGVINLAIGGTHLITANVAVVGDGKARNDSRAFEIDVELVDQFPYNENFDNMATCSGSATGTCELSNGWSNDTGDNFDWHVDAAGTSSGSTGPNTDVSGSGNYLYAETSSPNFGSKIAYANLPCVNIGGMSCPVLSFAYHMYGQTMGKMEVEVFDGQTWNTVYTLAGQQQTSGAAPWEYAQVLLSNYVNIGIIKIRFKCTSGSNFYSDMAIDDVSLLDVATDFQLDAVASTNVATTCDVVDFSGNSNVGLLVQKWDVIGGTQGRDWDLIQGTVRDRNVSIAFLKPGTYQVSFSGGALCGQDRKDTETIVVTQGVPNVDFSANSTTGKIGVDVFTLSDQTSPDPTDWTWRILPGTEGIDYVFSSGNSNSQSPSVIFLRPGRYSVRLTAGTFCGTSGAFKRDYFTINSLRPAAVGISNSEERLGEADHLSIHDMNILSVSPNPFSNYLQVNFVSLSEDMTEMKLANMIGQTVHTEVIKEMKVGLKEVKLNLPENLSAGIYTLTVRQGAQTKTMKVIKE